MPRFAKHHSFFFISIVCRELLLLVNFVFVATSNKLRLIFKKA